MWRGFIGSALTVLLLLVPTWAVAQSEEKLARLPEGPFVEPGASPGIDGAQRLGAAPAGSEVDSQFVDAEQMQPLPAEQRLLTMEKEWHAFQDAQNALRAVVHGYG